MDAGLAAIIAATISTFAGGLIGFISSYLSHRQSLKHARLQSTLPKQIESAEFISLIIFKALSGEDISNNQWDKFISASFWLPSETRTVCLNVLRDKQDSQLLKVAQQKMLHYFESLTEGE